MESIYQEEENIWFQTIWKAHGKVTSQCLNVWEKGGKLDKSDAEVGGVISYTLFSIKLQTSAIGFHPYANKLKLKLSEGNCRGCGGRTRKPNSPRWDGDVWIKKELG